MTSWCRKKGTFARAIASGNRAMIFGYRRGLSVPKESSFSGYESMIAQGQGEGPCQ